MSAARSAASATMALRRLLLDPRPLTGGNAASPSFASTISRRCLSSVPKTAKKDEEAEATPLAKPDAITNNNDADLYKETDMRPDYDADRNAVEIYSRALSKIDRDAVYTNTLLPDPMPVLPDDPSEVGALDPAYDTWEEGHVFDGTDRHRTATIRQVPKRPNQNPNDFEQRWVISFEDTGETAQKWDNPLMGWKSGADAMCSVTMALDEFDSAKEAVYFAKLRGWKYVVEEPIVRVVRRDGATYQDNFLPQAAASAVMRDGTKCDLWHRTDSGASHYFRPLKYHGDGKVEQFGPNPAAPVAKDVEGVYKTR